MNVENIRKVRDLIASRPAENVDMGSWGHGSIQNLCNTSGCIAGWVNVQRTIERKATENSSYLYVEFNDAPGAARYLGLDDYYDYTSGPTSGRSLFLMRGDVPYEMDYFDEAHRNGFLSPEDAAEFQKKAVLAVLDRMIETGEVDWASTLKAVDPDIWAKMVQKRGGGYDD